MDLSKEEQKKLMLQIQKLELDCAEWKQEASMWEKLVYEIREEIAQYRKALQVYADDDVIGAVARKALKG